ncbi:MAG: hypothetical protein M0R49_07735 [Limnochordia bacterium]|nr:hypothetical protein [Limnochordia bacterium]
MRTTDQPTAAQPTVDQLRKLYEAAAAFKQAEPWKWLYDADLICVENPEDGVIGYCSVMGRGGTYFALGVYLGEAGFAGFNYLMGNGDTIPHYETLHYQDALMASFEDREMLDKKDREEIKGLGLAFRGRNAWPQFRRFEPGYFPWFITSAECSFLTTALRQVLIVANQYRQGQVELDYAQGETVLRYSAEENGLRTWESREFQLDIPHLAYSPVEFLDDLLVQRLKRTGTRTNAILQVETCYLPMPIQEAKGRRPSFPRAFIVAEKKSGVVLDCHAYADPEDDANETLTKIGRLFSEKGIPKEIQVRPGKMGPILEDFCKKTDVKLRVVDRLASIEIFVRGLSEQF